MLDIQGIVSRAVGEMIESGELENQIKESVQHAIRETIKDEFRSYSKFGREVEAKVKESLAVNLSELSIPAYNQFILDQISMAVDSEIKETGQQELIDTVKHILEPGKTTYTLSELIEQFKSDIKNDLDDYSIELDSDEGCNNIFLKIEYNDRSYVYYVHIYLDEREELDSEYSSRYRISLSDGKPYSIRIDGQKITPMMMLNPLVKLDKILLDIRATGAKIELDKGKKDYSYDTTIYVNDEEEEY